MYIEKAKAVIKTLEPKQGSGPGGSVEVTVLRSQSSEKDKAIQTLEPVNSSIKLLSDKQLADSGTIPIAPWGKWVLSVRNKRIVLISIYLFPGDREDPDCGRLSHFLSILQPLNADAPQRFGITS